MEIGSDPFLNLLRKLVQKRRQFLTQPIPEQTGNNRFETIRQKRRQFLPEAAFYMSFYCFQDSLPSSTCVKLVDEGLDRQELLFDGLADAGKASSALNLGSKP